MTKTQSYIGGLRPFAFPGMVAAGVVAFATAAGFVTGANVNSTVTSVLDLSARSSSFVSQIGDFLPLGFAFGAGMVATVNPCGFVMLPAYLSLYVTDTGPGDERSPGTRVLKSVVVSAMVGLGFVVLFGSVGLAVSYGARSVVSIFPWVAFALGFVMAALGAYILGGGNVYASSASRTAGNIGDPRDNSMRGYFLFGISYAVASLSCTLPIFLGLISSSLARGGVSSAVGQFLAYALGMSFVIAALTVAIAIFKGALTTPLRKAMPYVTPISAGMLIAAGGYLIYYWLTEGGLAAKF